MSAGGELSVGDEVVVEVGPIAHGGHCVARHDGRVLFVRHTVPGERVRARVTEGGPGDRFLRADAIEVLDASPDRVTPPCPYAGPGRCGGCDFQHVQLGAQRRLKEAVVREQFSRLARIELPEEFTVEPVPGDVEGLAWRTRVEFAVAPSDRLGLRGHRSHDVIEIDACVIAVPSINESGVLARTWPDTDAVDVVAPRSGEVVVVPIPNDEPIPYVAEPVATQGFSSDFEVSARGFWQVHPGAAVTFIETVIGMLEPQPGERALDLYAGVGLFAAGLAQAVGETGQVIAVEADAQATLSAETNLAAYPHALVVTARVDDALGAARPKPKGPRRRGQDRPRRVAKHALIPPSADLVVLDPPRTGAGREVVAALASLRPRAIGYVACDPAALARDAAYLREVGYELTELRSFDAFPMTHHVECIARFAPVTTH